LIFFFTGWIGWPVGDATTRIRELSVSAEDGAGKRFAFFRRSEIVVVSIAVDTVVIF